MTLLALLAACGGLLPGDGDAGIRTWVETHTDAGGVLVVQIEADADAEVDLPEPRVEGLAFQPQGEPRIEEIGDHTVLTQRWSFAGKKGMYEIPSLVARYTSPDGDGALTSEPLWIDLGVEPPREGALADIAEPPRVWQPPGWAALAVGGGILVATAVGARLFFLGSRQAPVAPVKREPAHVRALREWEAVRDDPAIDDHAKTVALSRIFREYMEEVLRFNATAWTTTETLQHLQGLAFLPEGNVPRAKRLLRATDRVKFADAAARKEMFVELDSDLRAFLDSTRPRSWQVEEA